MRQRHIEWVGAKKIHVNIMIELYEAVKKFGSEWKLSFEVGKPGVCMIHLDYLNKKAREGHREVFMIGMDHLKEFREGRGGELYTILSTMHQRVLKKIAAKAKRDKNKS